ncbi:sulfite exporter TauE/SafE family protein [Motilimonas eburnea]|uniref:sulfite exporter TauE/SafE family protein n=1 Tax=Motilimonas eburnea TaxID=1737488 RepID=UPI001E3190C4|nr:sulfite exporter TauE/SafE family protein [Motilimonas eburnea]MCE2570400.1 sulfite exporter TauE/SafE family protein [Motilimonas eburnea]
MADFYAAFFIGLLGAGHCLGMCGGVASAMTFSINKDATKSQQWLTLLLYNLGRSSSYILAGMAIAGGAAVLSQLFDVKQALIMLRLLAASMMLLLALYISRLWLGLQALEKAGQHLWRRIQPIARFFLPLKHPVYAFPLGMAWGWLPCGLVYSSLSWAAVSGSALNGGLIMAGFALGTLPAMTTLGLLSHTVSRLIQSNWFRYGGSALLALYALHTGYIAIKQLI